MFISYLYVCLFTLFILLLLSFFFIDLFLSHMWMCVCVYLWRWCLCGCRFFFLKLFSSVKYQRSHSHIFDSVRQTTDFLVRYNVYFVIIIIIIIIFSSSFASSFAQLSFFPSTFHLRRIAQLCRFHCFNIAFIENNIYRWK